MHKQTKSFLFLPFLCLIIALMAIFNPVAKASEKKAYSETPVYELGLNQSQIELLKDWGLSSEDLQTMTLADLKKFLSKPIEKDNSKYNADNTLFPDMHTVVARTDIPQKTINLLSNLGFNDQEIQHMTLTDIYEIIIPYALAAYAVPSNYIYVPFVQYIGGNDEYFHPNGHSGSTNMQREANYAKTIAEHSFSRTYNYATTQANQNIRFSYYLFGEFDASIGTHEGIDMVDQLQTNRTIMSTMPGQVIRKDATNGILVVYNSQLDISVAYMHLKINANLSVGSNVTQNTALGTQDKILADGRHLHIQVTDGRTTNVASGKDLTLTSVYPYNYLIVLLN